jgi:hypothetical protein
MRRWVTRLLRRGRRYWKRSIHPPGYQVVGKPRRGRHGILVRVNRYGDPVIASWVFCPYEPERPLGDLVAATRRDFWIVLEHLWLNDRHRHITGEKTHYVRASVSFHDLSEVARFSVFNRRYDFLGKFGKPIRDRFAVLIMEEVVGVLLVATPEDVDWALEIEIARKSQLRQFYLIQS